MIELHPDRNAVIVGRLGPPAECVKVAVVLDHHVAGLAQLGAINHHVAGDQQPVSALTPRAIEPLQAVIGGVRRIGECLTHRGLHEAVRENLPAGQRQWVLG